MFTLSPTDDLSESWIAGDEEARWSSAAGHGPGVGAASSGSSLLRVEPGCRLPRHTDSAEETIVVTAGLAEVTVEDETERVPAGGLALVPAEARHEVRSVGDEPLCFVALYADANVVTRYEKEIQPSGSHETRPVA